jgi:hypothetical protein
MPPTNCSRLLTAVTLYSDKKTRASSGAEAVLTSTPTKLTQSSSEIEGGGWLEAARTHFATLNADGRLGAGARLARSFELIYRSFNRSVEARFCWISHQFAKLLVRSYLNPLLDFRSLPGIRSPTDRKFKSGAWYTAYTTAMVQISPSISSPRDADDVLSLGSYPLGIMVWGVSQAHAVNCKTDVQQVRRIGAAEGP